MKDNISYLKNYQLVSVGVISTVTQNSKDIKDLKRKFLLLDKTIIKSIPCKYRINDTLYNVKLYLTSKDSVFAMSTPTKLN